VHEFFGFHLEKNFNVQFLLKVFIFKPSQASRLVSSQKNVPRSSPKNELTNSVFTWWNEMFRGVPQKMNSQIVCSPGGMKRSKEFPKK
jgi:hypothetical protein